jgi:anti-sigma factor RsiW
MTEGVVHRFEAVKIKEQRRRHGPLASGTNQQLVGAVENKHPVRQASERVVQRLVAQLVGLDLDQSQGPVAGSRQWRITTRPAIAVVNNAATPTTSRPRAGNRSITGFQLADSANAPWTKTTVGSCSDMTFLFSLVGLT